MTTEEGIDYAEMVARPHMNALFEDLQERLGHADHGKVTVAGLASWLAIELQLASEVDPDDDPDTEKEFVVIANAALARWCKYRLAWAINQIGDTDGPSDFELIALGLAHGIAVLEQFKAAKTQEKSVAMLALLNRIGKDSEIDVPYELETARERVDVIWSRPYHTEQTDASPFSTPDHTDATDTET
jgi:hypothetical protein